MGTASHGARRISPLKESSDSLPVRHNTNAVTPNAPRFMIMYTTM
jgi:hypothetical protein